MSSTKLFTPFLIPVLLAIHAHVANSTEPYRVPLTVPSGYSVPVFTNEEKIIGQLALKSGILKKEDIESLENSMHTITTASSRHNAHQWRSIVATAASTHGVDKSILEALVLAESGGNPAAVSPKGAIGLCQLMPSTARRYKADPWDPKENVSAGAQYIREMIDTFQDIPLALAAYNAGPAAIFKHGGIPPYPETRAFIRNVLAKCGSAATGLQHVLSADADMEIITNNLPFIFASNKHKGGITNEPEQKTHSGSN